MKGLEPGAGAEDRDATYLWGAEHDRNTQRMLRPPQPSGVRTRAHRSHINQPFHPGTRVDKTKQGSRRPQDVAAYYRAIEDGGGRFPRRAVSANPALIRPYLDSADDEDRWQLLSSITAMHRNSRDPQLRGLADRSLAATIRTPDNPGGIEAADMFGHVLGQGSPTMVGTLMPHLPAGYIDENRETLSEHLRHRDHNMANKNPGDEEAVRAMFPDGYFDQSVDQSVDQPVDQPVDDGWHSGDGWQSDESDASDYWL